ncbi:ABC transporter permease [Streptococcus dentapri]|uniref:ABC transporter permease n=1 Tax=Streptococcus dentapri TaxID=573564 RepID=A0ABV8D1K5_9STRE
MITTVKRNLALYFSNKTSVFFSLMGAWIAFALYIIFLQKNMVDAWSSASHPEEMLDKWVMGGILAVTSVTTTWTGVARLVKDRESQKFNDFLLTDTSAFKLTLGYLVSASLIGFVMQIIMYGLMSLYFYWQDDVLIEWGEFLQIFGIMFLAAILGAGLGMIIVQFFRAIEAAERFSVIIGTASGFLVGVYMPLGGLPDVAQTVIKLTPAAYVAAAYRQIMVADKLINWKQPGINVKEYLGIGLKWDELTTLSQNILVVTAISLLALAALGIFLRFKSPKINHGSEIK